MTPRLPGIIKKFSARRDLASAKRIAAIEWLRMEVNAANLTLNQFADGRLTVTGSVGYGHRVVKISIDAQGWFTFENCPGTIERDDLLEAIATHMT